MATTTQISVEPYLRTIYHPDCDYIDGTIKERAVGELDHASWQGALLRWFGDHRLDWDIRVYPALRVQVAANTYRAPDVTVLSRSAPREQIVIVPPLAVFEVLSPTDTMTDMLERLEDYQQMGIAAIWVIEPRKCVYYQYSRGQLTPGATFALPGSDLSVAMSEIAALVD